MSSSKQSGSPLPKEFLESNELPDMSQGTIQLQQNSSSNSKSATTPEKWDDDEGNYVITVGEMFGNRYTIQELLGAGTFGQVVRAQDVASQSQVAIKIVKSKRSAWIQVMKELSILRYISDKGEDHNVVNLLTYFMYKNHLCLVLELLSLNLRDLLEQRKNVGIPLPELRGMTQQLLQALSFLSRINVIHCDVKPENIVLRNLSQMDVKLIDFSASCRTFDSSLLVKYVQTRMYRSPEVVLGLSYGVSIDMWSLACVFVELYTGQPLFYGSSQREVLQCTVEILGMIPDKMLDRSTNQIPLIILNGRQKQGQLKDDNPNSIEATPHSIYPSDNPVASLTETIMQRRAASLEGKESEQDDEVSLPEEALQFVDLVYQMLAFDPEQRVKPSRALEHPFLGVTPPR